MSVYVNNRVAYFNLFVTYFDQAQTLDEKQVFLFSNLCSVELLMTFFADQHAFYYK